MKKLLLAFIAYIASTVVTLAKVEIVWPSGGEEFSVASVVKVKAFVTNSASPIRRVEFYAGTNLFAVATNMPYVATWFAETPGSPFEWGSVDIKALSVDENDIRESSKIVTVSHIQAPSGPVIELLAPREGAVVLTGENLTAVVEVLASPTGDAGPFNLLIDGVPMLRMEGHTSLRSTTPPVIGVLTNLAPGTHRLRVEYLGRNGFLCRCPEVTFHVTELGVQNPKLRSDRQLSFELATTHIGRPIIFERSTDLVNWEPVAINVPVSRYSAVTVPATNSEAAWIRAVLRQ